jgi:hypothetical protein
MLALAGPIHLRLPTPVAGGIGWLGVTALVLAMTLIGPTTPYPGVAAAVPTIGTIALIVGGARVGSPGWLVLTRQPIRWIGRISYSLYLWHWPVLILGVTGIGLATGLPAPDILPVRLGLVLVATLLAWCSWRFVEEPFRIGRLSHGGHRRGLATGATVMLAVAIGSTAVGLNAQEAVAAPSGPTAEDQGASGDDGAVPGGRDIPTVISSLAPSSAGSSPTPSATPSPTSTASPKPTPRPALVARLDGPVPANLRPTLGAARGDDPTLITDGCGLGLAGVQPPVCAYGDPHGTVTIALVGDSHAEHWFPAFDRLAVRHHWRLVPLTKWSCVFVDLPIFSPNLDREYTECETWRGRVISVLRDLRPDLVVIASNRWLPTMQPRDDDPERQGAALARLIDRIPSPVALMVDTPRSDVDVPACLARHRDAIEACTTPRSDALSWRHRRRERAASKLTDAPLIDLTRSICPGDTCPPIIGRWLVYRDHHHLTASFATALASDLDAALEPILARPRT